ncbi:tmRNA-binding protein SmpB [Bacillus sp. ZZV12-4809]|nr:tmRNA-binding protein SmpB [Bacillus sp. ZZV12-4809]
MRLSLSFLAGLRVERGPQFCYNRGTARERMLHFLITGKGSKGGFNMPKGTGKMVAQNKKAYHDYAIEETYEAGIVLQGTEIKSIRAGKVNLKDSYARIQNNEIYLFGMHVSPYEQGNRYNHDPLRTRKLLLHRKEISKLIGESKEVGYSIVPLKMYLKNGYAKVLIGLARGKKKYDKREDLKKKEAKREVERAFRERQKM